MPKRYVVREIGKTEGKISRQHYVVSDTKNDTNASKIFQRKENAQTRAKELNSNKAGKGRKQ